MANKNNSKYDYLFSEEDKQQIINDYVINYLSIKNICAKYNIKCKDWVCKLLKNYTRSASEANRISHMLYPEKFKHSEETKQKIRNSRIQYLKTHRDCTAWRRANLSYPEAQFIEYLKSRKLDQKYLIEREHSFYPYYIDFAFIDIKLAVEIDGSQHLLPERKEKDQEKDKLLQENGWKVIRISENVVKTDWKLIDQELKNIINSDITFKKIGIIKSPKTHQKKPRNAFGLTEKQQLLHQRQRKVINRPSLQELENLLLTNSYVKVGKMFGVSGNCIRKWIKYYKRFL